MLEWFGLWNWLGFVVEGPTDAQSRFNSAMAMTMGIAVAACVMAMVVLAQEIERRRGTVDYDWRQRIGNWFHRPLVVRWGAVWLGVLIIAGPLSVFTLFTALCVIYGIAVFIRAPITGDVSAVAEYQRREEKGSKAAWPTLAALLPWEAANLLVITAWFWSRWLTASV